jgi:group I intron endonuclease
MATEMMQPNDYSNVQDDGLYYILNHRKHLIYVGESNGVRTRLSGHYRALMQGRHENKRLQADWNEQGGRDFSFNILELTPTKDRKELELHYIKVYQAEDPQFGYNGRKGFQPGNKGRGPAKVKNMLTRNRKAVNQ